MPLGTYGGRCHCSEWGAKAVIQNLSSSKQTQENLALLKILALGNRQIEEGKVQSAGEALQRLRERAGNR